MFKLLLTVFLGVCVGAVVADLLFGPDQPATPSSESQGQQWEPWRTWYLSLRRQSRRALAALTAWTITAGRAVDRGARKLGHSAVAIVQLVPDSVRSMQKRRQAVTERNAAHARHVAHLEAVAPVAPRHDLLPPPVAPPLHPGAPPELHGAADASRMSAMSGMGGTGGIDGTDTPAGPNGDSATAGPPAPAGPNGSGQAGPPGPVGPRDPTLPDRVDPVDGVDRGAPDPSEVRGQPRPAAAGPWGARLGPPMDPPRPVGPPVPASLRDQGLVETSEIPIDGALTPSGPLGRPPWDALVRRPTPRQAPTPGPGGPGADGRRRGRRRSRRDPLAWVPTDAERPPDPEWDEGVPAPIVVPMRVRARSAAMLLAMTTIFGVVTAAAVLIAVVMAVGALERF